MLLSLVVEFANMLLLLLNSDELVKDVKEEVDELLLLKRNDTIGILKLELELNEIGSP